MMRKKFQQTGRNIFEKNLRINIFSLYLSSLCRKFLLLSPHIVVINLYSIFTCSREIKIQLYKKKMETTISLNLFSMIDFLNE